jgi:hypothetical protein
MARILEVFHICIILEDFSCNTRVANTSWNVLPLYSEPRITSSHVECG